jgi:hypothetical protein
MLRFESSKTIPGRVVRHDLSVLDIRDGLSPDANQLAQLQLGHKGAMPQRLEAAGNFGFIVRFHGPIISAARNLRCA